MPTAHADQKRSVTFTESQGQQGAGKPPTPSTAEPPAEGRKASPALSPTVDVSSVSSATVTADLHGPANTQVRPAQRGYNTHSTLQDKLEHDDISELPRHLLLHYILY